MFIKNGQFGVACVAGIERVVHSTRRCVAENTQGLEAPDFVLLKVDLRNAFNRVSRKAILRLVRLHFPGMARWVHWCYGGTDDASFPYLYFGDAVLRSREGVQQGDPLGPLLFSLVIQEVVLAIRSQCPDLDLNKWYLDDGVIGGRNNLVSRALEVIQTVGPPLGMELNLSKNEIVKFTTQADCFPAEFKRFYRNFELLGAPIGDEVHCTEFIVK